MSSSENSSAEQEEASRQPMKENSDQIRETKSVALSVAGENAKTPRSAEGEGSAEGGGSAEKDKAKQTIHAEGKTRDAVIGGSGESGQTTGKKDKKPFDKVGTRQFVFVLLFNTLLVILLGWYLTLFWGKTNVIIEYSSEDCFSSSLNEESLKPLFKDTELTDRLRHALNAAPTRGMEAKCVEWLDDDKQSRLKAHWDDTCAPAVIKAADKLASDLKEERDKLLNEIKTSRFGPAGKPLTILANEVETKNEQVAVIKGLRTEMRLIKEGIHKQLTGRVDFLVGVLNTGNSDDVIKDSAILEWKTEGSHEKPKGQGAEAQGTKEDWRKLDLYACGYTIVKAHSIQQIRFIVDRAAKGQDVHEWEKTVAEHQVLITYQIKLSAANAPLSKWRPGSLLNDSEARRRAIAALPSRDCESSAP